MRGLVATACRLLPLPRVGCCHCCCRKSQKNHLYIEKHTKNIYVLNRTAVHWNYFPSINRRGICACVNASDTGASTPQWLLSLLFMIKESENTAKSFPFYKKGTRETFVVIRRTSVLSKISLSISPVEKRTLPGASPSLRGGRGRWVRPLRVERTGHPVGACAEPARGQLWPFLAPREATAVSLRGDLFSSIGAPTGPRASDRSLPGACGERRWG